MLTVSVLPWGWDLNFGIGEYAKTFTSKFVFIMTNRRQFLLGCSAFTVAAGLTPVTLWSAPAGEVSLAHIRFETFAAQLGTCFTVSKNSTATRTLKLVEATVTPSTHPLAHHAADGRNEKFSLLFRGTDDVALTQDTHVFEHADIGRFAMFIVPVKIQDATYYQAIFNRPVTGTAI